MYSKFQLVENLAKPFLMSPYYAATLTLKYGVE